MSEIRYVCLSDLHLGEEDSLLTRLIARGTDDYSIEPKEASPVMLSLVDCLKAIIGRDTEPPTLILAGDILELALAETQEAAMVFERFCELILGEEPLAKQIVYIPGNHDHHIWELAREVKATYVYVAGQDTGGPPTFIRVTVTVKYRDNPNVTLTRLVYAMQ